MERANEQSSRPGPNLRSTLTFAFVSIGMITLATAAALVAITTEMHALAGRLQRASAAVRDADRATTDVLLHSRAGDPVAQIELEQAVRRFLAEQDASRPSTRLAAAREAADRYFAVVRGSNEAADAAGSLADAYAAMDALSDELLGVAAEAQAGVARWDGAADRLGGVIVGVLLVTVTLLLWWVRQRAFRPVFSLARAMERFGAGDHGARAPVLGPAELAGMARRFNEMAEALARRRELQGAFLAGVAHDLRNPLAALRLAVRGLSAAGGVPQDSRTRKTLSLVDRQVDRLERMLTDLLDVARTESGQLELRIEQVDLATVCAEAVALFAGTSPEHDVSLRASGPVWVRCDPVRMEQVLVNLLSNAIKYSPAGGRVIVELDGAPGGVAVSVTDEGMGIAAGEEQVIFEPFRRSSRIVGVPGSGLGLFTVKRIVEAHGGTVRVAGNPGGGSRFTVDLPAEPAGVVDSLDRLGTMAATHR